MEQRVVVIGLGIVGLTTALRLCEKGRRVLGIDSSALVQKKLCQGKCTDFLQETLQKHLNKTFFLGNYDDIGDFETIIICVNTPTREGRISLLNLDKALNSLRPLQPRLLVIRSTIMPGTTEYYSKNRLCSWPLVYYPEFLRQNNAWSDSLDPSLKIYATLNTTGEYFEFLFQDSFLKVSIRTAEYIKYMNNSFHALKVAFANEMAALGSKLGVDIEECYKLFISDHKLNISSAYLCPGRSFGGACLEKDLAALQGFMRDKNVSSPLIDAISESNSVHKIRSLSSERENRFLESFH